MPSHTAPHRPITKEEPYGICFVCLGNICRSPTGEGVFIDLVKKEQVEDYFYIDSAGTAAYHTGEPANSKSQATANTYGVHLPSRARQFEAADYTSFDLVLAMDASNHSDLARLDQQNQYAHKLMMLRDFDPTPEDRNVPDPYYGGMAGFEHVFAIVRRSCETLLHQLLPHIKP
ncbi:MAG: low molecular weight protein-tyrosine-phosphatase [Bacteroidota bacterium]